MVVDRYYYSGIVYSAAKGRPDLSLDWARQPEVGLPKPDLCLFLNISPEAAAKRGGFGNEKYETSDMQMKVRQLFHELMNRSDGQDMRMVDAGRLVEEVEKDIAKEVERVLGSVKMKRVLESILRQGETPRAPG